MSTEDAVPAAPNGHGNVEMSAAIDKLAEALAAAQAEIEGATKDAANPFFNSKYADLASVWAACRGPLSKHGLAVLQAPSAHENEVSVSTMLLHSSGQWARSTLTTLAKDASPQAIGSSVTYLRRYGLSAMAGVAPEDDDGNAAQGSSAPPKPADKVKGYYRGIPPKSLAPAEVIGQPDRPAGPPTTEAEAQEAFPADADNRPFMLDACKRKVEGYKFSPKEREALKKLWLGGHAADLAKTADLHRLYLFLGDAEAVAQWRVEFAKAS